MVASHKQAFAHNNAMMWRFTASLVAGGIGGLAFGPVGFVGFGAIAGTVAMGLGFWLGLRKSDVDALRATNQEFLRERERKNMIKIARNNGAFDQWEAR